MPIKDDSLVSTSGRKHPVPQNVMDVEFKVVWDLTVRQLMYLFAGATIVYVFHTSGLPNFWRWVLMVGSGLLSIAIAFVPVQERGLDRWIVSFIKSMSSPAQKVWRKSYSPPAYFISDYAQIIRNEIITLTPAKSRGKLAEYLDTIPVQTSELDKTESEKLSNISRMYAQADIQFATTVKQEMEVPSFRQIQKSEINSKEELLESHQKQVIITSGPVDRTMTNLPSELKGEIKIKTRTTLPATIKSRDLNELEKQEDKLQKNIKELLVLTKKAKEQFSKAETNSKHKKTRLDSFKKKHDALQKERATLSDKLKVAQKKDGKEMRKHESQIQHLQKENEHLESTLKEIRKEINALKIASKQIVVKEPKFKIAKPAVKRISISTSPILSMKPNEKAPVIQLDQSGPITVEKTAKDTGKTRKKIAENVIHGSVKDPSGQLIEDAVILVKDEEGDVVRALQTNKLGAFQTQTSLPTGKYTVEIVKGKFKFDIISVDVNDKVLPPVHLIAKS